MAAFRVLASFFVFATLTLAADSHQAQWDAIAIQRASIERQLSAVSHQSASAEIQVASAQRQRLAVRKQQELVPTWKLELPMVETPIYEAPASAYLDCPALSNKEADSLVQSAASQQSLPADLIRAVIKQESGFHPCAISNAGAQGLMQLMPATAVDLHVTNPFDPKQNVQAGASYLKQLVNRYGGDLRMALSAYNSGMGRVDAAAGVPDIWETQNYVSSITGQLGYNELAPDLPVSVPNELPVPQEGKTLPQGASVRPVTLRLALGSVQFGGDSVSVRLNDEQNSKAQSVR